MTMTEEERAKAIEEIAGKAIAELAAIDGSTPDSKWTVDLAATMGSFAATVMVVAAAGGVNMHAVLRMLVDDKKCPPDANPPALAPLPPIAIEHSPVTVGSMLGSVVNILPFAKRLHAGLRYAFGQQDGSRESRIAIVGALAHQLVHYAERLAIDPALVVAQMQRATKRETCPVHGDARTSEAPPPSSNKDLN